MENGRGRKSSVFGISQTSCLKQIIASWPAISEQGWIKWWRKTSKSLGCSERVSEELRSFCGDPEGWDKVATSMSLPSRNPESGRRHRNEEGWKTGAHSSTKTTGFDQGAVLAERQRGANHQPLPCRDRERYVKTERVGESPLPWDLFYICCHLMRSLMTWLAEQRLGYWGLGAL